MKILKVQLVTVRRLVERYAISTRRIKFGTTSKVLYRKSELLELASKRSKLMSSREAARRLLMPVPVLEELRRNGIFTVTYCGPRSSSYAERDVAAFATRIQSRASAITDRSVPVIEWRKAVYLRLLTAHRKVKIVQAILDGRVRCWRAPSGTIADLVLSRSDVDELVDTAFGETEMTLQDAGRRLRVDLSAIRMLLKRGVLQSNNRDARGILESSVREFLRSHAVLQMRVAFNPAKLRVARRYLEQNRVRYFDVRNHANRSRKLIVPKAALPPIGALVASSSHRGRRWAPDGPYEISVRSYTNTLEFGRQETTLLRIAHEATANRRPG